MATKGKFAAMGCVNFNVGGEHAWWESNFFSTEPKIKAEDIVLYDST